LSRHTFSIQNGYLTQFISNWILISAKNFATAAEMDFTQLEECLEATTTSSSNLATPPCVSLEAEIPEALYIGMKDFLSSNPKWDQYRLMSSALANFLFQNGSEDRAVTERYLNDLFARDEA